MPETPDFDQIARSIIADDDVHELHVQRAIVEQLRQVWNARGEADMRVLVEPVGEIVDTIRALDR